MDVLSCSHEEADTRLILHALYAKTKGATEISIRSPDTDVLVLNIRRYPELTEKTSVILGSCKLRQTVKIRKPINYALGTEKAEALPGFHTSTRADQTGKIAGKGKASVGMCLNKVVHWSWLHLLI